MPSVRPTSLTAASETELVRQKPTEPKIDLKVLAEKVYELLKQEARLERERLGRR